MNPTENSALTINLQERIGKLCLSKQWSDCVFKIGASYIYAHRLILAIASPVFEVMLYGPLAEVKDIIIYDINRDTFETMLDFIYTDTSNICSVEEACRLLYAANKYMLKHLQLQCKAYIMKYISISNALEILDFAIAIDEQELIEISMNIVCAHTKYAFAEAEYHINSVTMLEIAKQDQINVSELDLFYIILQWSERECEVQELESTTQTLNALLIESGILSKIRFSTINKNEINNFIEKNDIIMNEVIQNFITRNMFNDNSVTPRKNVKLIWRYCICQYFKSAYPLCIDINNLRSQLVIICNKTVLVSSFKVASKLFPPNMQRPYNNMKCSYSEKIIVQIIDNLGNIVIHSLFKKDVNYNDNINIDLQKAVVLRQDEPYTIKFNWSSDDCSFTSSQYPQQFVSDIGSRNGVVFSIRNQEATFLYGITYAL